MEVYKSKYLRLVFEEDNSLLKVLWAKETEEMNDGEFRQELIEYAKIAEKYCPEKSLVDTQYFLMTVVPETQEWVSQNIHVRSLDAGIKKFAYVMSEDFFSQISIEQTMEEGDAHKIFDTQYFDSYEKAQAWLEV